VRYYLGKVSNLATVEVGTVIVAMFVGKEELGIFAVASTLAARVELIPNVLGTVILPRVASGAHGRPELVAQVARLAAVVCAGLLGTLVVFADSFVRIIFSPAFVAAVPLIRIIAAGTLMRCASKMVVPYLISRNRPGLASGAVFAGMVANLTTMVALIRKFGLPAAALAITLNHLVSSLILLEAFHRVSGMPRRRFWALTRSDWGLIQRAAGRLRPAMGGSADGL
jgi:O-antigen/teichoic acid export membrane protein